MGKLDQLMAQIARAKEPYWLAIEAMGYVVDAIPQSLTASDVYRLWGELSDRHELRPEKDTDTEVLMRRAASEWLETKDDPVARDRYLDRWLYDVCGYERPS
jgi:hypothetical protein